MRWIATRIAGEIVADDGCLVVEGRIVARVYAVRHGPGAGQWAWFFQALPTDSGRAADKADSPCWVAIFNRKPAMFRPLFLVLNHCVDDVLNKKSIFCAQLVFVAKGGRRGLRPE